MVRPEDDPEYEKRTLKLARMLSRLSEYHRSRMAEEYPRQMGAIAAVIATQPQQVLDELTLGSEMQKTPDPSAQIISSTGSGRFSSLRRFVSRVPLIGKFVRS